MADSSSATESDNLQLLRPDATTIFPRGDSIPVADSDAAVPAAAISTGGWLGIVVLVVAVAVVVYYLIVCSDDVC